MGHPLWVAVSARDLDALCLFVALSATFLDGASISWGGRAGEGRLSGNANLVVSSGRDKYLDSRP